MFENIEAVANKFVEDISSFPYVKAARVVPFNTNSVKEEYSGLYKDKNVLVALEKGSFEDGKINDTSILEAYENLFVLVELEEYNIYVTHVNRIYNGINQTKHIVLKSDKTVLLFWISMDKASKAVYINLVFGFGSPMLNQLSVTGTIRFVDDICKEYFPVENDYYRNMFITDPERYMLLTKQILSVTSIYIMNNNVKIGCKISENISWDSESVNI